MVSFFSRSKEKKPANAVNAKGGRANDTRSASKSSEQPSRNVGGVIPFRSMPEGRGGTFAFGGPTVRREEENPLKPQPETIHALYPYEYIGTSNCDTCVAVYFEMGDNLCFCAHLNFGVFGGGELVQPPGNEAEDMIKHIYKMFGEYQKRQGWRVDSVKKETLVIVSPGLNQGPGVAVKIGILRYFGLREDDPRITISDKAHGFVVKPGQPSSMEIFRTTIR